MSSTVTAQVRAAQAHRERNRAHSQLLGQQMRGTSGAGSTPSGGDGGGATAAQRRDARRLFPWMPKALFDVFVDAWIETGDAQVALGEMRQHPAYDQHFAGNRRPDGTVRFDEQTYLGIAEGYRIHLASYGLNPRLFEQRFGSLIEGNVMPDELARRLSRTFNEIVADLPETREMYARFYGRGDLSDVAIFGMAIDPQLSQDVLDRRVNAAQIGGVAATFGFDRARGRAEQLADAGLTREGAQGLYLGAARQLPALTAFASRYGDTFAQRFTLGQFEAAAAFGDVAQQRRIERLHAAEQAQFAQQGRVAEDQEGALRGLRPR